MLLALLFFMQDVDLDALGHPDPEERALAARALRSRPDALPLLLRGRRHPDPEVRARSADLLRHLSPLAWIPHRTSKESLDVLRSRLVFPAPDDARERSLQFLVQTIPGPGSVKGVLQAAAGYGQAIVLLGDLRGADLAAVQASAPLTDTLSGYERPEDVVFRFSQGVIWAGYRRDLADAPELLSWILGNLHDPQALHLLAQLMRSERAEALLDDPRPEATDLLVGVYALWRPEGPLDPRFAHRLAARLATSTGAQAGAASVVLKVHAKELAAVLVEGAKSPNRWWRFLSAAITASTPGAPADPAVYAGLLRDVAPEIRREAARATLYRVPPEFWDCPALLEAVEGCPELLRPLRESRYDRLQAAAVESLRRTPHASHAVLEDCVDGAILDAAATAMRELPAALERSTAVLRRMSETSDDPRIRGQLKKLFEGQDHDAGERAAYALGGLPAGEILGYLESHLDPTMRERTLIAFRRLGSRVEPDSCLAEHLRAILRARAEVESDPGTRDRLLELADAPAFVEVAPHRMRRLMSRSSGCGGVRRPQGGWRPLPTPAVPLPDWKD